MFQNKTLIAYETKGGATEEAARKIAETLRSNYQLEVDLVDLKQQKPSNLAQVPERGHRWRRQSRQSVRQNIRVS